MGLDQLGHDVTYVEDSGDSEWACYDPSTYVSGKDPSYGLGFAQQTFHRTGLGNKWVYYDAHESHWYGPAAGRIMDICRDADLLINISGSNLIRSWLEKVPVRVFVDTDPVFTQIRRISDASAKEFAHQHTHFFSFGENIGRECSAVPGDGFPWQATRQPVVLDAWPVTEGPLDGKFTTIMMWESFPRVDFEGLEYGMKSDTFPPFLDLPSKVASSLELAIGGKDVPKADLRVNGWTVADPLEHTKDPWTYQRYIRNSKAEFSLAKHGYVIAQPGWFSERSAAYLASGRPAIVQETGFSRWLATGAGVLAFQTLEEAVGCIEEVNRNYPSHCEAARKIAEDYFDSQTVLTSLLERVGQSPTGPATLMRDVSKG